METTKYFNTIFPTLLVGFSVLLIATFTQPHIHAAGTFSLIPASGSLIRSCTASVAIQEAITSDESNGADIIVTYNPAEIDIVDALPAISGIQILPGNAYESYAGNSVNTTTGTIKLVGYSTSSTLSSTATFATILFQPKTSASSGSFNITFTGANPYNSLDSNIADAATSYDMLSGVSNATYTFTTGSCATDTTSPTITFTHPTNLQNNVPPSSTVSLTLKDSGSGVALGTFSLTINGVTYTSTSPGVSVSGSPSSYNITVVPSEPFPENSLSVLTATVQDVAGNSQTKSITINANYSCPANPVKQPTSCTPSPTPTIDMTSPHIVITTPLEQLAKKQTALLSVTATDDTGISPESFLLTLGNTLFSLQHTPTSITTTGNKTAMTFVIKIDIDTLTKSPEGKIVGQIKVSDLAGNTRYESFILDTEEGRLSSAITSKNISISQLLGVGVGILATCLLGVLLYLLSLSWGNKIITVFDSTTKKAIRFPITTIKTPTNKVYTRNGTLTGGIHKNLPPGDYICTIQRYGYQTQTVAISISPDQQKKPLTVFLTKI